MRVPKTEIPDISPEEKSPLVAKLLGIIEHIILPKNWTGQ
jgi:hypothetical protein